ncbi:MAG: hypothetical protein ACE5WD_11410 [Candidatus Aminicenantia bacterium]
MSISYQNKKVIILVVSLLALVLLLGTGIYYYSLRRQPEEPSHGACLADDEFADYQIHKRKDDVSLATIFVKNKETKQEIFSFQIELPIPDHYHPIELHRCGVYATRSFNYDYTKKQALPNYKIELWRYYYSGDGKSQIFLSGPISGSGYGTDFRIDPTETYLVLERSYLGNPDYALVIKNLNTQEDIFVLPLKEIVDKYPELKGSIGFNEWTKDDRYFWGNIFDRADVLTFLRIERDTWKYEIFKVPSGTMGGDALNTELGYVTYDDGPPWTGDLDFATKKPIAGPPKFWDTKLRKAG